MGSLIVQTLENVTLVGAGPVKAGNFTDALALAPYLIAVDGGTEIARKYGEQVKCVIGDLDSAASDSLAPLPKADIHRIDEQETTDFDKALRSVQSPLIIGVGFTGGRIDHQLAAYSALVRHADRPCILLGKREIVFHVPTRLDLPLPRGSRFSLHPMRGVSGRSSGLEYPIDGINFAPGGMLGTSNRVTGERVRLEMDGPGMLAIAPREALAAVANALTV